MADDQNCEAEADAIVRAAAEFMTARRGRLAFSFHIMDEGPLPSWGWAERVEWRETLWLSIMSPTAKLIGTILVMDCGDTGYFTVSPAEAEPCICITEREFVCAIGELIGFGAIAIMGVSRADDAPIYQFECF